MTRFDLSRTRRISVAAGAAALAIAGASLAAGTANAGTGTISPAGTSFSAPGTITVTSPASFNRAVTCDVTFTGTTADDGKTASISGFTASGSNQLCAGAKYKGSWVLDADAPVSGVAAGRVTGVQFTVGSSNCGSASTVVNGSYSNSTHVLSSSNQSVAGSCTINNLSVTPNPNFTVS